MLNVESDVDDEAASGLVAFETRVVLRVGDGLEVPASGVACTRGRSGGTCGACGALRVAG